MTFNLTFILALVTIFPAVVGAWQHNKVDSRFHPFIYAMILAFINELMFKVAIVCKWPLILRFGIYNCYIPLNFYLFALFFSCMGVISRKTMLILLTVVLLCMAGTAIYLNSISEILMFAAIVSYAIIGILSANLLGRNVINPARKRENKFSFIMSTTALVMCVFLVFIAGYSQLATSSFLFRLDLFKVQAFINAACYLSFTFAILCLPKTKIY